MSDHVTNARAWIANYRVSEVAPLPVGPEHPLIWGPGLLEEIERLKAIAVKADAASCCFGLLGLYELTEKWGEPRHRDELRCSPPMTCGDIYRATDAFIALRQSLEPSHDD